MSAIRRNSHGCFRSAKQFISMENRYISPMFITLILLVGHFSFGILESYQKTLLAIAASIATEAHPLSRIFWQMAEHRQRLYHRHQRWHFDSLAGILALRGVQHRLHHLQIRYCA